MGAAPSKRSPVEGQLRSWFWGLQLGLGLGLGMGLGLRLVGLRRVTDVTDTCATNIHPPIHPPTHPNSHHVGHPSDYRLQLVVEIIPLRDVAPCIGNV